jgi:FtsP/CotA-like multicopper oxidase with cupredoxin domain
MVVTPDLRNLQYKEIRGVKYFELIAEEVTQEILPGLFIKAWGYNGSTPGPTILVNHGDYVNIRVYNNLPEPTSVHWHGLIVNNIMDGVPEVEPSPRIDPGYYFDYRFRIIDPPGTHMYHTHFISHKQQMMGLEGGLVIQEQYNENIDKDYYIFLQEFMLEDMPMGVVKPGTYNINPMGHDFNFFTMNGRCFPYTMPLEVKAGDKVRVRFANAMMDAHPMHIHGHQFHITASDGNTLADCNIKKNTVNVASGETWDIEFLADNPGRWVFHCHIPHHTSNNMTPPMGGMTSVIEYLQ